MKLMAVEVKVHLKSGSVIRGLVQEITKSTTDNQLDGLSWTGRMPFYFRLADISAIETRRVLNWKGWFWK